MYRIKKKAATKKTHLENARTWTQVIPTPTAEAKANLFIWQNVIEAHVPNPHYETDEQKGMVIDEMIRMLQA